LPKFGWLPTGASAAAAGIDHHFTITFILMGIVFVSGAGVLGAVRVEVPGTEVVQRAHYTHGNNTLELAWTILTAVLFIGLNWASKPLWASERFDAAKIGAVQS